MDNMIRQYLRIRLIHFVIFTVTFTGCNDDLDLPIPEVEDLIAVHSLFSPGEPWSVSVYYLHSNLDPVSGIESAKVTIVDEGGTSIELQHSGGGIYNSLSYPIADTRYTLYVEVEGYDIITATSYIPLASSIQNEYLEKKPPFSSAAYLYLDDHSLFVFDIKPNASANFSRIRMLRFNSDCGYNYYVFDENTFDAMEANGIEQSVISAIGDLIGETFYGCNSIYFALDQRLYGFEDALNLQEQIQILSYRGEIEYRHSEAFDMQLCYSPNNQFRINFNEGYTLLGYFQEDFHSEVYIPKYLVVDNEPTRELWMEYMDLSEDLYKYQNDYILQITNRFNVNSSPVTVYGNIVNGVGIFSGYQRQMIEVNSRLQPSN